MTIYTNKKRSETPTLKRGDKVYLLRHSANSKLLNIDIKRLSNKLDFKKLGLYKIKKAIELVNFKLALLHNLQIHLIFYIALLELVLNLILLLDKEEI